MSDIYDYIVEDQKGGKVSISAYKDKVLLRRVLSNYLILIIHQK